MTIQELQAIERDISLTLDVIMKLDDLFWRHGALSDDTREAVAQLMVKLRKEYEEMAQKGLIGAKSLL